MSSARPATFAGESAPKTEPVSLPELEIRHADARDRAACDAFVSAAPRSTFFHQSTWGRSVERVFGHRAADLVALSEGRVVGVLPLMRTSGLRGRSLISMPYAVYGGTVGEDRVIEGRLVRAAVELAERERVRRLELRFLEDPGLPLDLARSDLYATFIQDLPQDPAAVLASMPKKARAEARKARERHGLVLTEGGWYLGDLYRLFLANKRKLGSPALPEAWFQELLTAFRPHCTIHVVHRQSEPLMAVMSFVWRDTLMAYYAGTAEGADREYSASNFAYMALREWAVAKGLRRFDFGRSRKDAGAFSFKEHQGFAAQDLRYMHHLVRDRSLPSFTPSNPRTKLLRDVWARMPSWLDARLSNVLSRYLP